MLSQDEQIALFVDAINKNALKMRREIEKETKKLYNEEVQKLESEAETRLEEKLAYAENDIDTELNRAAAERKSAYRRDLYKRREELTQDVFNKASEILFDFTKKPEYDIFLVRSIKSVSEIFHSSFVLYVRDADFERAKNALKISGLECVVQETSAIKLGGIIAECEAENKIINDTLDERLAQQRDWFLSHTASLLDL